MAEPTSVPTPEPPPETHAPFTSGSVLRRLGRRVELDERSRVLEFRVAGRSAAVLLARDLGCRATVADPSGEALERVRAEAEAAGVLRQLSLLEVDLAAPSLPEGAFDLAISGGRVAEVGPLATLLRPALVPTRGRLVAVVAAKVGRAPGDIGPWERAFGARLRLPQAELGELVLSGYEPEWAEALSEAQLVELYGARPAPPEEEAALLQAGPGGISLVLVAGRRREPDERPPPARERG